MRGLYTTSGYISPSLIYVCYTSVLISIKNKGPKIKGIIIDIDSMSGFWFTTVSKATRNRTLQVLYKPAKVEELESSTDSSPDVVV